MYPTTNLQLGMSGPEVVKLQNFLKGQGMSIPSGSTGYFGNETKSALAQWQGSVGIPSSTPGFGTNWGQKSIAVAQTVNSSKTPAQSGIPGLAGGRPLNFGDTTITGLSGGNIAAAERTQSNPPLSFGQTNPPPASSSSVNNNSSGSTTSQTGMSATDMEKAIDDALHAIIGSGYAINPGLTPEDIAAIDPAKFMESAAATIAPEYQQKFAVASDTLKRALGNTKEDYDSSVEKTNREADASLLTGTETLAGRGLAFSGAREKFIGDIGYERQLGLDDAARTAQRTGQTALGTAEGLLGTSGVQNLGVNTNIGGRSLAFSSTPIVGSYNSEKAYTTESIAKQLASQEAQRRSYATRQLSFA